MAPIERLPMTDDDAFLSRLQATIAALRYWVPSVSDTARIEERDAGGTWELVVRPLFKAACPFTLKLASDHTWGLAINGVTYDGQQIETLDIFVPLVEAISEGRVVHRRWLSANTGAETKVETIIDLGNGRIWSGEHHRPGPSGSSPLEVVRRDHHFLAYRRH